MALSAHALASDREQALAAGCDDFDTKPVEFARLVAKMEALLAPGAAGAPPAQAPAPGVTIDAGVARLEPPPGSAMAEGAP